MNTQTSGQLDFRVRKAPITAEGGIPVPGKCALIREDNNKAIAVVGDKFGVIQNEDLFPAIDDKVFKSIGKADLEKSYTKDSTAYDGQICYREYIFPSLAATEDGAPTGRTSKGGLDLGFMATVVNGFGGSSLRVYGGAIDFYCNNGMVMGKRDAAYQRRHSARIETHGVDTAIADAIQMYRDKTGTWREWAKKHITDTQASDFLLEGEEIPQGLGKKLLVRFQAEKEDRGSTVWALFSALTHYASHTGSGPFAVRQTKNDHEASTRMSRHLEVARITNSPSFLELAA